MPGATFFVGQSRGDGKPANEAATATVGLGVLAAFLKT
jgi:hypothetical protein